MSSIATDSTTRVLVTGGNGLLGYHARCAILADNCASDFANLPRKYKFVDAPRLDESSIDQLVGLLKSADVILHFAGINRDTPSMLEHGNKQIASYLVRALSEAESNAHVIYANSTHAAMDTHYGRGKQAVHELLLEWSVSSSGKYTNVVLPHIFGEAARPFYNNVTATLCTQVVANEAPEIHDGANVELVHAGKVVDYMLEIYDKELQGSHRLEGKFLLVADLFEKIKSYKSAYEENWYPDLTDPFSAALFNTYRYYEFPEAFPRALSLHKDARGVLYEAVKGGGGGQTFLSWTKPGVERGNHFHRSKVERFLVVSGQAQIKIRPVLCDRVEIFTVSGDIPVYIDMPTLHTHSIINTGTTPLLTLFWTNEIFNPSKPDTYAHPVQLL